MGVARRTRRTLDEWYRRLGDPESRRRLRAEQLRLRQFKGRYGVVVKDCLAEASTARKKVLIVGKLFHHLETQIALLKAMARAGFAPAVLIMARQRTVPACFRWAGVREFHDWRGFVDRLDFSSAAARFVNGCGSLEQLLKFEHAGSRCGKIAASTALRQLLAGALDLRSPEVRSVLGDQLASAMAAAGAARNLLDKARPQLVLTSDVDYTPGGELFDICMDRGIDVVTYHAGHRNNTLVLKRYSQQIRDQNPVSLSEESWRLLRSMQWTDEHRRELKEELSRGYSGGNWYGVAGTQFHTRVADPGVVRARLGLSPGKRTAFVFPHIPWDATWRWGEDLFPNHEDWLAETVRAARGNDSVNWVIKFHPANVNKLAGNRHLEPAEMAALRRLGPLPRHIAVIPPDSDISTYSLFGIMDYCVTVRGTVGIEAASFGIPVITAGTGRYERKGFTLDSASREQYLDRIARIHEIGPLSPAQTELAERFAYGIFLLRPLPLRAISLEFSSDPIREGGFTRSWINIATKDGWHSAPDIGVLADWIGEAGNPDFLGETAPGAMTGAE